MDELSERVLAATSESAAGEAYGGNNVNDGKSAVGDADENEGELRSSPASGSRSERT